MSDDALWDELCQEAIQEMERDAALGPWLQKTVLQRPDLETALAALLKGKLDCADEGIPPVEQLLEQGFRSAPGVGAAMRADLAAVRERDSACTTLLEPFLYFKGFHALQVHRCAHVLWNQERRVLAKFLQSRSSEIFAVDIHPAAWIGSGLMMDHATGIVIGETSVIENNVSIMQDVTLGGTGKEQGDRHPKVEEGVLISAGAKIIGNIRIGAGAKIGAGSVVLQDVPPHTTVAGVPARQVGHPQVPAPALAMDHRLRADMEEDSEKD